MTNMQQNKKRKHDDGEFSPQHHSASSGNAHQIIKQNDEHNFEAALNEEVIRANSLLISIGSKIKLVDNLYFAKNGAMIDEFIENMDQFIQQLESHRKKTCNDLLNSDILMNVYEFLNTDTLKNCCGLVSKLWRESLTSGGLKVKLCHNNFFNSSLVNHVNELKLEWPTNVKVFESLSACTSLNRLKILDLSECFSLDSTQVELLMKCNMPCLSELKMSFVTINETDMIQLLTSNLMSTIKKLNLSTLIADFTNNFYESVSESKNLQQITHLEIENYSPQVGKRIDLLLKDKFNLEHLQLSKYQSTYFTKLLTNGNYMNLTFLDISYCFIKNQEFANLLVSPNLPNLITLKADYLNRQCRSREIDETIAIFPANSQSSITELHFNDFKPEMFPSLFDHCPKLKKLTIDPGIFEESEFKSLMKSPNLSKLEVLTMNNVDVFDDIFINPLFSNLKELNIYYKSYFHNVKVLSTCTNLVNLTTLDMGGTEVCREEFVEECSKMLKTNPTFAKLKNIELPFYDDDD